MHLIMLACVQSYGIVAHKLAKIQPPALGQVIIPSGYITHVTNQGEGVYMQNIEFSDGSDLRDFLISQPKSLG